MMVPFFQAEHQTIYEKSGPAVLRYFYYAIYFQSVNGENCVNLQPFSSKNEEKLNYFN